MSTQRSAKYPSPRKLGIAVLSHLFVDIEVETEPGALWRQVLLRLASSSLKDLSAKCTLCSFNSSTLQFMFEFNSTRDVWLVNWNMNSVVLEAESVKFAPFSVELHQKLPASRVCLGAPVPLWPSMLLTFEEDQNTQLLFIDSLATAHGH